MKNISKIKIRRVGILLSIYLILLCLPSRIEATESSFTILPFQKSSSTIYGKMQPEDKAYIQFKHQLFTVKSNKKGEFSISLKQSVENEKIVLFQKDKDGFEQKTITQNATDADIDNPNRVPPPSYLGIQDNQFVFESKDDYKIYVIYEGQTYSGNGSLRVPKKQSDELKFFGRDDLYGYGEKSKVVTKQANESEVLSLDSFDVEGSRLKGKAWPYGLLKVLDQEGNIKQFIELESDGKIDVHIPLSPSELEEGTAFTVQDARSNVPLFNRKIQITPFIPKKEKPIYFTHDIRDNTVRVKTYSDAQVQLDQKDCSLDAMSIFSCSLLLSENPTHELKVIRNGQSTIEVFFDTGFNVESFPFSLVQPLTSKNAELIGKTLPNKEFEIKADNGLAINFTSDAAGQINLKLPNSYNLGYQISLKMKDNSYQIIKHLNVIDNREIPKPTLKFQNGELIVFNPMYGKDAHLKAELLIEKSNGEWDFKQLMFDQWRQELKQINFTDIQDGDHYTLTLSKTDNDFNSLVLKGIFKRNLKPEYYTGKSNSTTLVGRTSPFASVLLNVPIFRNYESSYMMRRDYKTKADASGIFKIKLDEKSPFRIDYFGNFEATITSENGLIKDAYYQRVDDVTLPKIRLASKYIADTDPGFGLLSDDRLNKIEIKYFSNDKLIKEKIFSPVGQLYFVNNPEKQISFKKNAINKIMVRATNVSQKGSQWSTFKVMNTDFPKVQLQNVYVGDKEIKGTNSGKTSFELIVNDKKYAVKPSNNGTFKVKLVVPIKKGTKSIKIILKNEVDNTQLVSKKVLIRKKK